MLPPCVSENTPLIRPSVRLKALAMYSRYPSLKIKSSASEAINNMTTLESYGCCYVGRWRSQNYYPNPDEKLNTFCCGSLINVGMPIVVLT